MLRDPVIEKVEEMTTVYIADDEIRSKNNSFPLPALKEYMPTILKKLRKTSVFVFYCYFTASKRAVACASISAILSSATTNSPVAQASGFTETAVNSPAALVRINGKRSL